MKFHAGDFSVDNASWLCRPVEGDRDEIEAVVENNQHSTTRKIANIHSRSKSIKLLVKMRCVFLFYRIKTYALFG